MPPRSGKQPEASNDGEPTLAELAREVFGDLPSHGSGHLNEPEQWWSRQYEWLKVSGYLLRSRYAPDWTPSWKGTKKSWAFCEDGCATPYPTRVLDGTRISDGSYVMLKRIKNTYHPYEIDIALYLSSEPLVASVNHCVPIYDVLPVPGEEDNAIMVMPLLQNYSKLPFETIGEAVECFRQLFEAQGLDFMHKHRIAHRDCSTRNIMMDPTQIYIDPFHPSSSILRRDFSGYARYKTRTERPPKYFFIDFGLSRRYDHSIAKPMEVPIWGADKQVPEFQGSNAPCDPFATDVFYIGNTIRKDFLLYNVGFEFMRPLIIDMIQPEPSKRPTMDEVVQRFTDIRGSLSTRQLRHRIVSNEEKGIRRVMRDAYHWIRQLIFIARGIPAVPASS